MQNKKNPSPNDPKNNKCAICRANGTPPPCKGHANVAGASGGGSGSSESYGASQGATQSNASNGAILANLAYTVDTISTFDMAIDPKTGLPFKHSIHPFNPDLIAEMLANKSLLVSHNPEACILHIHISPAAQLTKDQRVALDAYANAVLKVFNEFIKDNKLNPNALSPNRDAEGYLTSLKISLSPNLYPAFIAALEKNHLLLPKHLENNKQQAADFLKQSPFSMRPEPGDKKKTQPEIAYSNKKKTPFKTELKPDDRK